MKRKLFLLLSVVLMTLALTAPVYADENPSVILDGKTLTFDVPPMIENGRTLVPMRKIFEELGATITWDDASQTVTATKGNTVIKLVIGGKALKNGSEVTLDVPAKIVEDRTMVPLRFVSEALGAKVGWDENTQAVTLTSPATSTPANQTNPAATAAETPFEKYLNLLPLDPSKIANVKDKEAQFIISGDHAGKYAIAIKDGKLTWSKGSATNPSITIFTQEDVWLDVVERKIDPSKAFLEQRFKAEGDVNFFTDLVYAFIKAKPADQANTAAPADKTPFEKYLDTLPLLPSMIANVKDKQAQFIIIGEHAGKYTVNIKDGKLTWSKGAAPKPDITIYTEENVWLDVVNRRIDPSKAFLQQKFKAEGDVNFFTEIVYTFIKMPN